MSQGFNTICQEKKKVSAKALSTQTPTPTSTPTLATHRQEHMASDTQREGYDQSIVPALDLPFVRHDRGSENDHHETACEADDEGQLEALPDPWNWVGRLARVEFEPMQQDQPSIQNVDRSTSFPVDPHVLKALMSISGCRVITEVTRVKGSHMLYENRCARTAVDR